MEEQKAQAESELAELEIRVAEQQSLMQGAFMLPQELANKLSVRQGELSNQDLELLRKGTRSEDIEAARAELERQQRQLAVLLKQRMETDVKSTVAGVVQSFGLRPGDIVAANQGVAEILEESQLWVRIYVPETMLGLLRVNQAARVRVDTFPNQWYNGRVATISSQGEYTPRNVQTAEERSKLVYRIKITADNRNGVLKPGMPVEAELTGVESSR